MLASKETDVQSLKQLLDRFNSSSARLEERHDDLLKEMERLKLELKEKDREIQAKDRLAFLGETAAHLAHEVRNPLGAIKLFVSLLREDVADRPDALKIAEEIGKSITSLDGVVSNILQFANTKELVVAPLNVHAVLNELIEHFRSVMQPPGELSLEMAGNPFVMGDTVGLRQVFYNLINNAVQATQRRGAIRIVTTDSPTNNFHRIRICDNGPGVPAAVKARLFEPFVSGRREGTGLGLSIVKRILDMHGASIVYAFEDGALFTIDLPRKRGAV